MRLKDMTSSIRKHKHHIIPRHAGGTDDPSNIVELTIEEHAEAHRKLYKKYGRWQDKVAWKSLSQQITFAEATRQAQSEANQWHNKTEAGKKATYDNLKLATQSNIGRKHDKEWLRKQSVSNKIYWRKMKDRPWQRKTYTIEGKTYHGLKEIMNKYQCTMSAVYARFKSKHYPGWVNTKGGFKNGLA